jgi:hypothetical protein
MKLDGYWMHARVDAGRVNILTRRGNGHIAAALGAAAATVLFGFMHDLGARQMVGQRLPLWPGALA